MPTIHQPIRISAFTIRFPELILYTIFALLGIYLTNLSSSSLPSILALPLNDDVRCFHMPPSPDQVTRIWLDDLNSTTKDDISEQFKIEDQLIRSPYPAAPSDKTKRHISLSRNIVHSRQVFGDRFKSSLGNSAKYSSQNVPQRIGKDELVPVKIHIHYDSSVNQLEKQKLNLINGTVMPSVVKFFESVLSIRREHKIETFKMTRRCPNNTIYYAKEFTGSPRPYCMERCEDYAICGEVIVPKNHISACSFCNPITKRCITDHSVEGEGVFDAQLVLYVSAKQTARCKKDQTIAYAAHCAQDSKTDRPVAGHANLCPSSISTDAKDLKALIATVKHELTHVLGFSVSLFAYYRDEFGNPLSERDSFSGPILADPKTGYAKWSDRIIKKVTRTGWKTGEGEVDKEVHMIVTPTVVREVREHFNCSTLEGAELEDQGFDGTSMTHWEKRLFENEAMTGTHTQNSVYSRLTLAVLQDTGWYIANFSRAEKLDWGRNLGCNFAKKSCKSWIDDRRSENKSIRPFCDKVKGELLQIACTEDRTSKAVCNMKQYQDPLPMVYRNFDSLESVSNKSLAYYGGSVDLADYCPFIQEFTWQTQNVTVRGSRCDLGGNNFETDRNAALEFYGPQTKCFEHGRRWEQKSCTFKRHWHHYGAGCYKYTCSNGHLSILIGSHSYSCYYPDQIIRVEQLVDHWLYNGTIVCPPCEKVCAQHKCKTYNKAFIDRLLELHSSLNSTERGNLLTKQTLRSIVDDALNSVEAGANSVVKPITNHLTSKGSNLEHKSDSKIQENLDIQNHLIEMLANHKEPIRDDLVCSGSCRMPFNYYLLTSVILICFLEKPFRYLMCRSNENLDAISR